MGTITGRFKGKKRSIIELPKGANYMVTTNRAQLAAAIKAVPNGSITIVDAINESGERLIRYTFKGARRTLNKVLCDRDREHINQHNDKKYAMHLRSIARNVMKTPAAYWR